MLRKLDATSTIILTLMGLGHTAFTPTFASGWTEAAAWFSGSGLALVFLGLLNVARLWGRGEDRLLRRLCLAGNALGLLWIAFVVSVLPVPQAFVVAGAILGATLPVLRPPR